MLYLWTEEAEAQAFPPCFDRLVEHASGQAVFGLDVLANLVAGLEEELAAPLWFRSWDGRARLRHVDGRPDLIDVLDRRPTTASSCGTRPATGTPNPTS